MKEHCIQCGKETEYDVSTPITERSCFVPGRGQMCFECFCKAYKIPVMHGLYAFERVKGHQIQPTRCTLFSSEEVDAIQQAAFIMDRMFQNLNRSMAVEEALKEFKEEVQKPNSENPYDLAEVDRRFRAFIFEWKLFTEHWKNYIYSLDRDRRYVADYKKLYWDTMNAAFRKADFMLAHVIRNYVSHANDAIDSCHIGGGNKYWIHKRSLLRFLDVSIAKERNNSQENHLIEQKTFIETCDEMIDLEAVADGAMKCLVEIQEPLMNHQLDQDTINACLMLLDAKKRIDENSVEDEVWEIWKPISDPSWQSRKVDMITLQVHCEEYDIAARYGHIRLNWSGYAAVASYLVHLWENAHDGSHV